MPVPRPYLLLLAALAGCATPRLTSEQVNLPAAGWPPGVGDPTRGAILSASYAFAHPDRLAGNPAAAARSVGELEYITAELGAGGRWAETPALVVNALQEGRAEARDALGLRRDLAPQRAVDGLFAAAGALEAGDSAGAAAALAPLSGPGDGAATLDRLGDLPPLPRTTQATTMAFHALWLREREPDSE